MKRFLSRLSATPIWVAAALVIGVAGLVGFLIDGWGFLGNLMAEIVGMVIGIIVALTIVDMHIRHLKQQEWERVRKNTYRALCAHLSDLAFEMMTHFPVSHAQMGSVIEGGEQPSSKTIEAMRWLADELRKLPDAVTSQQSNSDLAVEF